MNQSKEIIKIGDYVHASRWSDQDPNDPWCVGVVTEIRGDYIVVGKYSNRLWPRWVKITAEEGLSILKDRNVVGY